MILESKYAPDAEGTPFEKPRLEKFWDANESVGKVELQVVDLHQEKTTLAYDATSGHTYGSVDGPNLYTYVRQNPWSKFDPHGLEEDQEEEVVQPEETASDNAPVFRFQLSGENKPLDLTFKGADGLLASMKGKQSQVAQAISKSESRLDAIMERASVANITLAGLGFGKGENLESATSAGSDLATGVGMKLVGTTLQGFNAANNAADMASATSSDELLKNTGEFARDAIGVSGKLIKVNPIVTAVQVGSNVGSAFGGVIVDFEGELRTRNFLQKQNAIFKRDINSLSSQIRTTRELFLFKQQNPSSRLGPRNRVR